MKLKLLREHFVSKDLGKTWRPKDKFNDIDDIKKANYNLDNWHPYTCSICGKLHVAKVRG